MDFTDKNVAIIAECIRKDEYKEVETDRSAPKNSHQGWGDDWCESACAFPNTNGGIIVIGIHDKNNTKPVPYKFTGHINSDPNEKHLKQEPPNTSTDRNRKTQALERYINQVEIRDFLNGKVAVVYVQSLPDDEKYVFYHGKACKRKLTGNHEPAHAEGEEYQELKHDIIRRQEPASVPDTSLETLDIAVLNNYPNAFNRGKKRGETIKGSLEDALSFLYRENVVRKNAQEEFLPAILGTLVCGDHVESYVQGKCRADCCAIPPKSAAQMVARAQETISDNIVELTQRGVNFVRRNIRVGILYAGGGTAAPECPGGLIREGINNAFAHRNYQTDRFVIIEIRPNESLMTRNPGQFEQRQRTHIDTAFGKIRRIIPIQVAHNPKLTHLLKRVDLWEGKSRGLASLIDACLGNAIDLPYYILTWGEIKLFIPKGRVFDDVMGIWLDSFAGYITTRAKVRGIISQPGKKKSIVRKDGKTKEAGGKPDFRINTAFTPLSTLITS